MSIHTSLRAILPALVVSALFTSSAHGQFGGFGVNLPNTDFTWRWGDQEIDAARGTHDFSANGGESGFRCELTGKLRPGSRLSSMDIREIESELRVSMFFIQSATNTMNALDLQRELDWAELDCVQPQETEVDAAKQAERLEKARARAMREQAERRERLEREEARAAERD